MCSTSDIESCIEYLEEKLESSEPGASCLSDTAVAIEESIKGEASSRAASQQAGTKPLASNQAGATKAAYCSRGNSTCPPCFKIFPLEEIKGHADLCIDNWIDPVGELEEELQEWMEPEEPARASPANENNSDSLEKLKDVFEMLQKIVDSAKKTRIRI